MIVAAYSGFFLAVAVFFAAGALSGAVAQMLGRKFDTVISGFAGGLLIALVCFAALGPALAASGFFVGILCILAGVTSTALLFEKNKLLCLGGLGLLEGSVVGGLMLLGGGVAPLLAAVAGIRFYKAAKAMALSSDKSDGHMAALMVMCLLVAGLLLGASLALLMPVFAAWPLAFGGGAMIYMACGEALPKPASIWDGRLHILGSIAGFAAGAALLAGI